MNKTLIALGKDFYSALALLIMGLVIQFWIIPTTIQVYNNPFMTASPLVQNGRVMPSLYASLIIISGLTLLIQQIRRYFAHKTKPLEQISFKEMMEETGPAVIYVAIVICFILLLPLIGYMLSTFLSLIALYATYAYDNKINIVISCIVLPVGLYYIFTKFLMLSL